MSIILYPEDSNVSPGTPRPCDDLLVIRPETETSEGCPVLTKERTVLVDRGVAGVIEWELRDRSGNPLNLLDCLGDCSSVSGDSSASEETCAEVLVRFNDALGTCSGPIEVTAQVVDASAGIVRVTVPSEISNQAGIYSMTFGVTNANGDVIFTNSGLLSIEPGLFGDPTQTFGPPSLMEIRLQLRDSVAENTLLQAMEFSDVEIVSSLRRPIDEFNESPPPLGYNFSTRDFPWRNNWIDACIANLLRIAAHNYRRNKLQMTGGGLAADDKNRDDAYVVAARELEMKWKEFVMRKKVELNAQQCYGSVGSPYSRSRW